MIDNKARDIPSVRNSSVSDNEEAIESVISSASDNERAIAIAIVIASTVDSMLETSVERTIAVYRAISKATDLTLDPNLERSLQNLKTQLPNPEGDRLILRQWWKEYGQTWTNQLRDAQIQFRNLVYEYQFSDSQITLLDQYYRANLLLIDCLNSDCYVSQTVRDEIEATLLLSIEDIEQHKQLSGKSLKT